MSATSEKPKILIGSQFVDGVLPLILAAKRSIDIVVFDWRIYMGQTGGSVRKFNEAIIEASKRGVWVRALVNNKAVMNWLREAGIDAKILTTERLVHAKMMLVDGRTAIVGSHNYTQNAFTMNYEVSLCVDMGAEENELVTYFAQLWKL